jgi:thiamine-phosphate pyrophosphorylase
MRGLYLVTPDWNDTDKLIAATERAIEGGATLLQYRHKTASEALRFEQASALLALCRRLQVPMIINDQTSVALRPMRSP